MLLMATKTTSYLSISPPNPNHTKISIKTNKNHIFFTIKSSSKTSKDSTFSTTIKPSAVYNEPITISQINDHNAKMCRFCKLGNLKKAMKLLHWFQKSELDSNTYCSILQLCAERKSLRDGNEVHSIICSNNVVVDCMLGSKLVFMYVSCGDLSKGRRVFDKIMRDCENVFLWNFMINGYAKIGDYEEGINLYHLMHNLGVEMDCYTFNTVLKCCGGLKSVEKGEMVHGVLVKLGFDSSNMVANSLIAFYSKCGRVCSAYQVFDNLVDRDVISWNSMIGGYVTNDLAEKAVMVFIEMLRSGVDFDSATMVSVVSACTNIGNLCLGKVLHGFAVKACFEEESILTNAIIDLYSKCGDLDCAYRVFEKMGCKTNVSWNSLISGYAREGQSDKAVSLFGDMIGDGVTPDVFTITSVLHACTLDRSLENGKHVHSYIRETNLQSNLSVSNTLIDMFAKCRSMVDAKTVFSTMIRRDIVTWNSMIAGFVQNSLPNQALKMFLEMQNELTPDNITITCVLPACGSLGAVDRGREIHSWVLKKDISSDQYVLNALLDMYVKCGEIALARSLFPTMPKKDLISWTVMIAGYCKHMLGKEAIAAFQELRRSSIQPDEVSFISILYACTQSCLVNEGLHFFNSMRNEFNIEPKLEQYTWIVDIISRSENLSDAYQFIKKMSITPDAAIWGTLLSACRVHHDVKLAEKVAEKVFELEPENTKYYLLLACIYEETEKWEENTKAKARANQRSLRRKLLS